MLQGRAVLTRERDNGAQHWQTFSLGGGVKNLIINGEGDMLVGGGGATPHRLCMVQAHSQVLQSARCHLQYDLKMLHTRGEHVHVVGVGSKEHLMHAEGDPHTLELLGNFLQNCVQS
eukprot:6462059-Amphidinium_carterae.2